MSDEQKRKIRELIILNSSKCIDILYDTDPTPDHSQYWRGKWYVPRDGKLIKNYHVLPVSLDCSGLVEGVYRKVGLNMPDGTQNQFNITLSTDNPRPGDLCFFGHDKDITKIYHVGMVYSDSEVIEAREPDGREWTGKVTLRGRPIWEKWKNFCGYRVHPKLI